MSARALILTYQAIERGPAPLCTEPSLFEAQLDLIAESGVRPVTLGQILEELEAGRPGEPSVAITFDDGFASVVERAAPLLLERELPATIFCVAGHLGGMNVWRTQRHATARLSLASAQALSELAANGLELGSHGLHHEPLTVADGQLLERESLDSRHVLEYATGTSVRWFAYPYNAVPRAPQARALVRRAYAGACAGGNRTIGARTDTFGLPRVDAHYLRRLSLFRRALEDADLYLGLRRIGARVRRLAQRDFAGGPPDPAYAGSLVTDGMSPGTTGPRGHTP